MKNIKTNKIVTYAALAAIAMLVTGLYMLSVTNAVYAPSARRGFYVTPGEKFSAFLEPDHHGDVIKMSCSIAALHNHMSAICSEI